MLAALIDDWKKGHPDGAAVFHFVGATSSGRQAEGLFRRLLSLVSQSAGKDLPGGLSKDFLPNALRKLIEDFPADKRLLIAVDDFDLVFQSEGFDLRWLPEQIPSNVSILLSALDDQSWSELNLRQLSKAGARLIALPALREHERKEIIRKIPSLWAKTLDSAQIDLLSNHPATNNPLFLSITLEELRKFGSFERLEKRIQNFPHLTGERGLILLYGQLIDRLERELGREVVKQALGLLACSLTGLGEEEIVQLSPGIGGEELAQLWRELRVHLQFNQGSLSFYHETFKLSVQQRYLATPADKRGFHRQLANFFEGHNDKERALAELLEHYHELGEPEAIRQLLGNLENYLVMRQSYPNWLNTHWNRIEESNPLALLHASLCANLGAYEQVLNHEDGIPLDFWQVSDQGAEIRYYDEARDQHIHPVLEPWQHDLLIELSRAVEESKLSGEYQLYLAIKCLAILEAELGAVHARTLEALSVALPLLATQLSGESAIEYHTRAFTMATVYLPEHHPVSLKIRMHTQDFFRKINDRHDFQSDFDELVQAYVGTGSCDKLRELDRDALVREDQRNELFAYLLIRHSQMLRQAGESQSAGEFCRKAVSFCDKELGPLHEYAILARNNLAMFYINLKNDFEGGRKILEETLSNADSRVGTNSYIGLTLLNNLSTSMGNAGKFEEALPIYQETVERKKAVYGLRNASTLHSIYNLAFCHRHLGHFDEALELCRQAIAGFEALGKGYKSDLVQMKLQEIGIIGESGDPALAHRLFEPFYKSFMSDFDGSDWLSYYLLNAKQAEVFKAQNKPFEAALVYEETLAALSPVQAATKQIDLVFRDLLDVLQELLHVKDRDENTEHRLAILERMVSACQTRFPEGDPLLSHWQSEYGATLNTAKRFQEAEAVLRICVRDLTGMKGEDDPNTRIASTRLSQSLWGLGKTDEANALLINVNEASASRKTDVVSMMERYVQDFESKHGKDHPATIDGMQKAAQMLITEKHPREALDLLTEAYRRSEESFGMLTAQTVSIASDLAALHIDFEEYTKAELILRRVADSYEREKGLNHAPTLEALKALGEALLAMNESSEATAVFLKVLEGSKAIYGPHAYQTLNACLQLSRLYKAVKNEEKFSACYAEFISGINTLGKSRRVKELYKAYRQQEDIERKSRIEDSLTALQESIKQEKLPFLEKEALWKQAESMSERDLDPENPEGSGELLKWLDLMIWMIPEKSTVDRWTGFCKDFETLCENTDPVKYLPRFKFALWILRNEGTDMAVDQLSNIWRDGELESYYVQEAAYLLFETLAKSYPAEKVIPVAENMGNSFIELLGPAHPRVHLFINKTAHFFFEIREFRLAGERYNFLRDQTEGVLDENHPFRQNILQQLAAIDREK